MRLDWQLTSYTLATPPDHVIHSGKGHHKVFTCSPTGLNFESGNFVMYQITSQAASFLFFVCFFWGGNFHENWFHPPSGPTTDGEVGSCQEMDGLATKFFLLIILWEIYLRCTRAWWVPKRKEQQGVGIVQIRPLLLQFFFCLSFILPRTHDSLLLLLMPACLQRMVERTI